MLASLASRSCVMVLIVTRLPLISLRADSAADEGAKVREQSGKHGDAKETYVSECEQDFGSRQPGMEER